MVIQDLPGSRAIITQTSLSDEYEWHFYSRERERVPFLFLPLLFHFISPIVLSCLSTLAYNPFWFDLEPYLYHLFRVILQLTERRNVVNSFIQAGFCSISFFLSVTLFCVKYSSPWRIDPTWFVPNVLSIVVVVDLISNKPSACVYS